MGINYKGRRIVAVRGAQLYADWLEQTRNVVTSVKPDRIEPGTETRDDVQN